MSEMKSLTLNGKTYDSFVDKEARESIKNLSPGGSGTPGEDGGYYTPKVEQTDANTMKVSYTASKGGMPEVAEQSITLPAGPKYKLTETDKQEIAEQAAQLVEVPEGDATVEPAEDDIPKFFYGSALPQTKDDTVMPIRYISKTRDISGYCETKAQGNSSMGAPKKNQTTKFYKDADCTEKLKVDFKGWGEQNKFCFKANWIDLTQARNVVSARLWADVVKSRTNYAELPELLRTSPNQGAVDGFPIKVYAAGIYQGRYTLNIPKDKWTFNMDDELDTHCALCGENYISGCFRASAQIDGNDWTDEIHDTVPASIKTRWNEVISFVMNSTDDQFKENLNQYFFVDSLIDYYLFGLASCGLDAFGKNQIYATYDGQRWIASMYDMDATWGLWWNGSKFVPTNYSRTEFQDFQDGNGNLLYIRLEQLFYEEIQNRWEELKSDALSIENIINRFERFTDIASSELVKEDYASTTGEGKFTGIPSRDTNNIQQIRSFALARLEWANGYVADLSPAIPVPCTGITLSAETLTFTAEGTQTLVATVTPEGCTDTVTWESTDSSIVSVDDGVITAKANGTATITATCGEYSDTCSVTVSGIESGESGGDIVDDGVDYTLNPLQGVNWNAGYYYHDTTGVLTAASNNGASDKFTLQNCLYAFTLPSKGATVFYAIYVWDENGDYITNFGHKTSGGTVYFTAKAGYQYAVRAQSSNVELSEITLMPVDNRQTAVASFSVTLADLAWTQASNRVEADVGSIFDEHGVSLENAHNTVRNANMIVAFHNTSDANSVTQPISFCMLVYSGKLLLKSTASIELADLQTYFAESNPVLIFNS